jgi:hypothetical protein
MAQSGIKPHEELRKPLPFDCRCDSSIHSVSKANGNGLAFLEKNSILSQRMEIGPWSYPHWTFVQFHSGLKKCKHGQL